MNTATPLRRAGAMALGLGLALTWSTDGTGNGMLPDLREVPPYMGTGWLVDSGAAVSDVVLPPTVFPPSDQVNANADMLEHVRLESGLTWEQIAQLFNVSRRSVHLWLAGGRMSAANEGRLVRLTQYVSALLGSPEVKRRQLLASAESGRSFFDETRMALASRADDINRQLEPLVEAE